jgi:hypothetical protein
MNRLILKILISFAIGASVVGLYSCGGGNTQVADGGIGGTGITQGRVTNFGSVFVNGIEFNTDNATYTVNNNSEASQNDLAIGMVVRISGSSDPSNATGSAESITYDSLIEGVVISNDIAASNTLSVMDQTIVVDGDTVYQNRIDTTPLESLPVNSVVEVSGFTDGGGEILATRIEVKSLAWSGDILEVSGLISALTGTQFQIGSLTIEASALQSIPPEGTFVEVKGSGFSGGVFIAESIEIEDIVFAGDGEEVEIEGQITQALDANDRFALNGQIVDVSATALSGAVDQLTLDRVAKVEGVMNGDILFADEIKLNAIASERGEISGLLGTDGIDIGAATVTLLGQTIQVDNSTIMENDLDDDEHDHFALSDLTAGDYLQAKVYSDNGRLVASKLELDNPPRRYDAEVVGLPEFIDDSTIRVLGVTVNTSGVTGYTFVERTVDVKGDFIDGVLYADSISTDDDDDHHDEHDD